MQNINVLPSLNMVRSRLRKKFVQGMRNLNKYSFKLIMCTIVRRRNSI